MIFQILICIFSKYKKKWIGKAVNEIEVKLLANGKEVQTAKLNEANSWKHTFKDYFLIQNSV